ncbi:MAG TPA: DNA repair protein RecN [Marmoricola sp.]|nr:DNA repair protein RecN [Marmoricola sp.]
MIEEIRIRSLGVIDESILEFAEGFTVITGETGAGKTMLVTALGLLLGARADTGAVRTGAAMARVEGAIRVSSNTPAGKAITETVVEAGGELEDGLLLVGRQVGESRSRAFVGGSAVPVSVLSDLADQLVAVHGQSDQHRLLRPETQLEALDEYGGAKLDKVLVTYRDRFRRLRRVERELADARAQARDRLREAELLRLGLAEIEKVSPKVGEDLELRAEEDRLANADTLRLAADTASGALSADDGPDALGALGAARRALDGVKEHDAQAGALAERIAEITYIVNDLAGDVASYAHGIDVDPLRLASVAQRRADLSGLTRAYGETLNEVLAWADESSRRLLELDQSESRIAELEEEVAQLGQEVATLAEELSELRRKAAKALSKAVTSEIQALSMQHAHLEVQVQASESLHDSGADEVEFLLAANAGLEPRPLNRGASGGELSRVMLGLEVVLANTRTVPTFVFDEVDAGVGGRAAVEIGRRLAMLSKSAQVLVVTHLPQVAAFADQHVVVRKSAEGSVTTSDVTTLDQAERVVELSRMLAGQDESDSAQAHARELLEMARGSQA